MVPMKFTIAMNDDVKCDDRSDFLEQVDSLGRATISSSGRKEYYSQQHCIISLALELYGTRRDPCCLGLGSY